MTDCIDFDVSVIICAYDMARWPQLVAAVESIRQQTAPPREIIVVIDHNPELFDRAGAGLPDVVLLENREARGLSGARNTGIAVAQGRFLAFLDDDAVAAPTWLEWFGRYSTDERVLGLGGATAPVWAVARPAWFPEEFLWVVGCSYRGLPAATSEVRNPFGGCMCVRREVFETVGGFRSGVGRIGARLLGCEETELCIRARQHWPNRVFLFEPRARICHHVPASRGRWAYFLSRCYSEGLSKAAVSRLVGTSDSLSSEWTYVLATLPKSIATNLTVAVSRLDAAAALRVMAILAGLFATTSGYVAGTLSESWATVWHAFHHANNKTEPKKTSCPS